MLELLMTFLNIYHSSWGIIQHTHFFFLIMMSASWKVYHPSQKRRKHYTLYRKQKEMLWGFCNREVMGEGLSWYKQSTAPHITSFMAKATSGDTGLMRPQSTGVNKQGFICHQAKNSIDSQGISSPDTHNKWNIYPYQLSEMPFIASILTQGNQIAHVNRTIPQGIITHKRKQVVSSQQ